MRTEIHPKGCKTHDGIRTVQGCAVCRAERVEKALIAIVAAYDKQRRHMCNSLLAEGTRRGLVASVLLTVNDPPEIAEARAALSEEEGTPLCPECEHYDGSHSPLCPSPATASEAQECQHPLPHYTFPPGTKYEGRTQCEACGSLIGGSGRATPRGRCNHPNWVECDAACRATPRGQP